METLQGNDQPPAELGASREYNVDMTPKFMMANEILVGVLIHANVTNYLDFNAVDGSLCTIKERFTKFQQLMLKH